MYISFRFLRKIVVYYKRKLVDVDSARRNVGGDQNANAVILEVLERRLTLPLGFVSVDRRGFDPVL